MGWENVKGITGGQERIIDNRKPGGGSSDDVEFSDLTEQVPDTGDALAMIDAALARSKGKKQFWGQISPQTVQRGPCHC